VLQLAIALIVLAMLPAPAEAVTPAPYTATYAVRYRGLNAGLIHFELRIEEAGKFVFGSRADPSPIARLFVGGDAVERTVMRIDAEGVRPLMWFAHDGRSGEKGDGSLTFFWNEGRVRGTVEGRAIELPTEPGLQDRLSIQVAVMTALLASREPGTIPMIADDEIKRYSYTRAGADRIRTRAGEFETVLYESTRPGSSRLSRIWHARELGYIPVRAEQLRNGKVETVMELTRVVQDEVAVPKK
jgi:hypothetical protein